MTFYWVLFLLPVLATFVPLHGTRVLQQVMWLVVAVAFTLAIGLREEIGCDWWNYLEHYQATVGASLYESLLGKDPGYGVVNWFSGRVGGGIYLVNLICGAIFMCGLLRLCYRQPLSVLAFAISVPYLVVVVSMGYTRQAAALGFVMWALSMDRGGRTWGYFLLILIGALFHKSAVVMLPLGLLAFSSGRIMQTTVAFAFAIAGGILLMIEHFEALWDTYVSAQLQSGGALIRVILNGLAALVFLLLRKKWDERWGDGHLWRWLAWGSLASLAIVWGPSTAVDRLALYLLPLQLVVFSRLPLIFSDHATRASVAIVLILGYGTMLFVWLNFASHADCWVPYRSVLE